MDAPPGLTRKLAVWGKASPRFLEAFASLADGNEPEEPPPPSAVCEVRYLDGHPAARAAVQVERNFAGKEGPTGILGWFAARERAAAVRLLRYGGADAPEPSAVRLLGPMNGSTWGRYRLALPGDSDEPPFPGEPTNRPEYPEYFLAADFRVAAEYESRIVEDLSPRPGAAALARRLEREGIRFRPLNPADGERELDALYILASAAFAENPYYRPISREEFGAIYGPLLARIDPQFVRLAQDANGRLLGFALAYPEGNSPEARVVLKSVASAPDARALGLGAALSDQAYARTRERGFRSVIHALMHSQNPSAAISRRYGGRIFRRYALYEWTP